jgi:regulator of sigma E protease
MVVTLEPEAVSAEEGVIGRIGAAVQPPVDVLKGLYTKERYSPLAALRQALNKTVQVCALTLRMLWKMVLLEVSVENLSGPISIAQYAGSSAQVGIAQFLQFLGIVSVSLGILNLLPIPVLDGGHLMYYLVELLKGSPVSESAQLFGQRLGIAMLFGLMGLAFYNDLVRLFG